MKRPDALREIYARLLARFGPQHWWPAETRFEVMVGAVLTQATAWGNVEKAIARLKEADALSPGGLRRLPVDELAQLVYPSGYYNAKARKLKALVMYLGERFGDDLDAMGRSDTPALREELLGIHGIGDETADDILLYALGKPVFVVDAYTRRLFHRLGLAPERGPTRSTARSSPTACPTTRRCSASTTRSSSGWAWSTAGRPPSAPGAACWRSAPQARRILRGEAGASCRRAQSREARSPARTLPDLTTRV